MAPSDHTGVAAGVRQVAVVLNGAAGALLEQPAATAELRRVLHDHSLSPVFIEPDTGSLPERMRLACATGAGMLVVGGGDGSVACATQTLMDLREAGTDVPPLGILPSGTMNLLARDLGLPIGDMLEAVRTLATGTPRAIDVGEVNGHVFLCGSMLGEPARLARHRESGRGARSRWRAWLSLTRAGLRAMRRGYGVRVAVVTESEGLRVRTPSLTVTVGPLAADGDHPFARARPDAGTLSIYIVRQLGLFSAMGLMARFLTRSWRGHSRLHELHATEATVTATTDALRVMNDGEVMLLPPPLRYRVHARALRVIVPST